MPLKISLHPLDRNPTGSDASAFTELGERAFENDPVHIARGHGRGISPAQREEILAWRRARFAVRSKATEVHVFKAVATADDEEESGEGRFVGAIALVAPSERPGAAAGGAGGAGGVEGEKKTEAGEGEGGGRPKRYEGVPAFLNLAVFDEMERVMTAAQKRHVGDVSKVWCKFLFFLPLSPLRYSASISILSPKLQLTDSPSNPQTSKPCSSTRTTKAAGSVAS